MNAALVLSGVRRKSSWSLRRLGAVARTSHATLSAYEHGRVDPSVGTLERIVRSAGYELEPGLVRSIPDLDSRGQELLDVLELAEQFPARHPRTLTCPPFGRR